jgi:hypothetical protein
MSTQRHHPLLSLVRRAALSAILFFSMALSAFVQPAGTGSIVGWIFNPLMGECIRNAEVRVQGTDGIVVSETDARYRFSNVPAGNVTLAVSYTGYEPAVEGVAVAAGQVVTKDFDLQRTTAQRNEKAIELDRYTVSSRREGTAKAIMEQRVF